MGGWVVVVVGPSRHPGRPPRAGLRGPGSLSEPPLVQVEGIAALLRALPPRLDAAIAGVVARISAAIRDVAESGAERGPGPLEELEGAGAVSVSAVVSEDGRHDLGGWAP